ATQTAPAHADAPAQPHPRAIHQNPSDDNRSSPDESLPDNSSQTAPAARPVHSKAVPAKSGFPQLRFHSQVQAPHPPSPARNFQPAAPFPQPAAYYLRKNTTSDSILSKLPAASIAHPLPS